MAMSLSDYVDKSWREVRYVREKVVGYLLLALINVSTSCRISITAPRHYVQLYIITFILCTVSTFIFYINLIGRAELAYKSLSLKMVL